MTQMKLFKVTVIVPERGWNKTVTVKALDEWKARTLAPVSAGFPLRGEYVEFKVEETSST